MMRKKLPRFEGSFTVYQAKFRAKREIRAYHGEHIREKQLKKVYTSKLPGVVDSKKGQTPFASQAMLVLERRLDYAVFRALLASSVRQARQMVLGGRVKLNGEVCREASHALKPGDHFSVDPYVVLPLLSQEGPKDLRRLLPEELDSNWEPRDYIAPFLFIPKYLEVDFATCSAVYVRDPLARPNQMEIPSPFPESMHALCHSFYRRRWAKKK